MNILNDVIAFYLHSSVLVPVNNYCPRHEKLSLSLLYEAILSRVSTQSNVDTRIS